MAEEIAGTQSSDAQQSSKAQPKSKFICTWQQLRDKAPRAILFPERKSARYLDAVCAPQLLCTRPVDRVPEALQVALLAPEAVVAEPRVLEHAHTQERV